MLKFLFGLAILTAALLSLDTPANAAPLGRPPIRHVFLLVLENESADETFGANSPAPYLAHDLVSRGALLTGYYGIGHYSLDNYIAMISGQGPNHVTQSDCQNYVDFKMTQMDAMGQALGSGCVYPSAVPTLADQLTKAGFAWKDYSEDMGNNPAREAATCGHPALNGPDNTQKAQPAANGRPADQYATRHNPFMYFHSVIDSAACATNVVNFDSLRHDLQSVSTTANFVFITPSLCNDGHDGDGTGKKTCVNGDPGGLTSADKFLRQWVPIITASPAYKQDGLLVITFDEAEIDIWYDAATKTYREKSGDATACCGEVNGPNINSGQTVFDAPDDGPGVIGPGGGRIGAVLLSPFVKAGTVSNAPYNHYSLLRTIEDFFDLDHLGYAQGSEVKSMGVDVFAPAAPH